MAGDRTSDPPYVKQTLYHVAIKAGFYHKAVQVCYISNTTTKFRFKTSDNIENTTGATWKTLFCACRRFDHLTSRRQVCSSMRHTSIKSRQRLKLFKDVYYGTGRSFQKGSYHWKSHIIDLSTLLTTRTTVSFGVLTGKHQGETTNSISG